MGKIIEEITSKKFTITEKDDQSKHDVVFLSDVVEILTKAQVENPTTKRELTVIEEIVKLADMKVKTAIDDLRKVAEMLHSNKKFHTLMTEFPDIHSSIDMGIVNIYRNLGGDDRNDLLQIMLKFD